MAALVLAGGMVLALALRLRKRKAAAGALHAAPSHGERRRGANAGAEPGLQGNLAQTPMHDLLQFIALGKRTGALQVASGRRAGTVWFVEGTIVKNTFRGKQGMEGLFQVLDLKEGDFEFQEQEVSSEASDSVYEVIDVIMVWMGRSAKKPERSS